MIATLLRKNISQWQLGAYAVACFVGLTIVLVSAAFYNDVSAAQKSSVASDYIVLSKPVSLLSAFGIGNQQATQFSTTEINELSTQPWVKRIGRFTSADFNIVASVDFAGRGLSTALFFESLPDDFVDVDLDDWSFEPGQQYLPIIVPRDYLALYNYGFAASRGLPQISEDLIKEVPLNIVIAGNGHYDTMTGRIAGLSSRLNTIAVPEEFMVWANERYGSHSGAEAQPSRLMVELSSPGDPSIDKCLKGHDIESSANDITAGRTAYIAKVAAGVIGGIGAVIAALSVMILLLSVFLLIQKNSDKIRDLSLLGYRRRQIGVFYVKMIVTINVSVTVLAIAAATAISRLWIKAFESMDIASGLNRISIIVIAAIAIMGPVTAIALGSCKLMINKAYR